MDDRGKEGIPADQSNVEKNTPSLMTRMSKYKISMEQAAKYDKPSFLYPNLIIKGHFIVLPARPNGGKTTIMLWIAAKLTQLKLDIFYVNADIGQSDSVEMVQFAEENNIHLLLPDMNPGLSMDDVIIDLVDANNSDDDLSKMVFIFDTLKKMTEVINKSAAKKLYQLLRSLTAKGMTIIVLSHTNKYPDKDGNLIFEGTGDLIADSDELIYFYDKVNADGSMTVTTKPDKKRGKIKPISFEISEDRQVKALDHIVDVANDYKQYSQDEKSEPLIAAISEAIGDGKTKQFEIIAFCKNFKFGQKAITNVLFQYSQLGREDFLWSVNSGAEYNTKFYSLARNLLEKSTPPWER